MKRIAFLLCLVSCALMVKAQSNSDGYRNRVALGGLLTSSDTWQMDLSYHYMMLPYVGVGASVGYWAQFAIDGVPQGDGWRIGDDYKKVQNFYLRPSLHLVTPTLMKIADAQLRLFAEPGFIMNIPYCNVGVSLLDAHGLERDVQNVSTSKGDWYAFDCKAGLSLFVDNVSISAGYQYSTLDVLGMRRELVYNNKLFNDFYSKRKVQHGGFVTIGYHF